MFVLFSGGTGVAFKLLKRGNKGKMEAQEVVVPTSTSLAAQVNRNEEASREESSIIKARVCSHAVPLTLPCALVVRCCHVLVDDTVPTCCVFTFFSVCVAICGGDREEARPEEIPFVKARTRVPSLLIFESIAWTSLDPLCLKLHVCAGMPADCGRMHLVAVALKL